MEAIESKKQKSSINILVNVLLLLCMIALVYHAVASLSFFGALWDITDWDDCCEIPKVYKKLNSLIFYLMTVTFVSCILCIVYFIKLLKGKKSGFWGFAVTMTAASIVNVVLLSLVDEGFAQIYADVPFQPVWQLVWTALASFVVWLILQIREDGVSCWRQME